MRSELEILEQIDLYLGGKMSAEQSAAFEAKISADPQLKTMVEDQQLLIQTVNRQALMAEINAVAGIAGAAGGASWGLTQWLITLVSVATLGVGSILIYNYVTSESVEDNPIIQEEITSISDNNESDQGAMDSSELFSFSMEAENELISSDTMAIEMTYDYGLESDEQVLEEVPLGGAMIALNSNEQINHSSQKDNHTGISVSNNSNPTLKSSKKSNLKATFPGGRPALKKFFKKNLLYPRTPYDKGISGTVKVTFVVTADGLLENIESDCYIMFDREGKPLSSGKVLTNKKSKDVFEESAERVFRISSPWEPATDSEGNPILTVQTWFVKFNLNGESEVYPRLETEESFNNTKEENWTAVEIRVMNVKSTPKDFKIKGENIIKTTKKIKDIEDLTNEEYREISSIAAKSGATVVYLDVNGFWNGQEEGLYYSFGNFPD